MNLIPIEYNNIPYPSQIECNIKEIAGHLDKSEICVSGAYSLHTEYSFGKRKFNSPLLINKNSIVNAHKNGVPQLWKSDLWAEDFANFVLDLTKNSPPHIIEIHPPFSDYCDIDSFVNRYLIFEKIIHDSCPKSIIVIENRAGSRYRGGKFILSTANDIAQFITLLKEHCVNLGVVIDFPQLLTAERLDTLNMDFEKLSYCFELLKPHISHIKGIHMWGKKKSTSGRWVSHCGNLNTFFLNDETKSTFVNMIKNLFNDNNYRFFVPEVNSLQEDLLSIVGDFFI